MSNTKISRETISYFTNNLILNKMRVKNFLWAVLFALLSLNLFSCTADDESAPVDVNIRAVNQPTATITVSGVINTNTIWTSDNEYLLSGKVYVSGNAALTIQAGTLIKGLPSTDPENASALIITRGSKIIAEGTASNPIVFTADNGTKGGWGGLVLLGKAPNNQGTDVLIEGIDPSTAPEGVDVYYGGSDIDDDSGILKYVRVEFAGASIAPNNELNSFTFGSVGCGTILEHLQSYYGADDGFEWFGGTVNARYLISTAADDDAFDFDFGYCGKLQFLVAVLDPNISYSANANGIECDNEGSTLNPPSIPFTRPVISNLTIVGTSNGSAAGGIVQYGAHFRRATRLVLRNSVLYGYNKVIYLQGVPVYKWLGTDLNNTCSDSSYLANNVIGLIPEAVAYDPDTAVTVNSIDTVYTDIKIKNPFSYSGFFKTTGITGYALCPTANPALTGADFTGLIPFTCPCCPFDFEDTDYKGAIPPNGDYWIAAGWVNTNFPIVPNN